MPKSQPLPTKCKNLLLSLKTNNCFFSFYAPILVNRKLVELEFYSLNALKESMEPLKQTYSFLILTNRNVASFHGQKSYFARAYSSIFFLVWNLLDFFWPNKCVCVCVCGFWFNEFYRCLVQNLFCATECFDLIFVILLCFFCSIKWK